MPGEGEPKIKKPEQLPQIQDIISVDGRWGQLATSGDPQQVEAIIWLDGKEPQYGRIDFKEYTLKEAINKTAGDIKKEFTEEEIKKIHWGDQKEDRSLKLEVTVFGRYTRKG
jgi:hypothetical protein